MESNMMSDFTTVPFCRSCLISTQNMKPLNAYHKRFTVLTSVELPEDDGDNGNWLCQECCAMLDRFEFFKDRAIKVDELIKKHYLTQSKSDYIKELRDLYIVNRRKIELSKMCIIEVCHKCSTLSNDNFETRPSVIAQIDEDFPTLVETESWCILDSHQPRNSIKHIDFIDNLKDLSDDDESDSEDNLNINDDESSSEDNIPKRLRSMKNKTSIVSKVKTQKKRTKKRNNIEQPQLKMKRKHRKREWVSKILDSKKIQVINLTLDEQTKELEERRESDDFRNARYKCDLCVKVFPYVESLENHMQRHEKSFGTCECNICHLRFTEERVLKSHITAHSRRYLCQKCDRLLHFKTTMANHLLRHENTYVCHTCGHHSKDKESNRLHQKSHAKSERFKCSMCPRVLNNKHDYGVHMRRHTGDMPFACELCGKCFPTGATLAIHKSVHSTTREFYCARCDVSFKTREIMLTHLKKSLRHIDPDLLTFACDQCPKKFETESQRQLHVERYHLRCVQLFCDMCPARFVSTNGLRNHRLRKHEGFRPALSHVCETCGRAFSTKALVTNHLRTHTGERPFECETCRRRFTQKSSLQTHIRLVHLKLKRNRKSVQDQVEQKSQFEEEQQEHWTTQTT